MISGGTLVNDRNLHRILVCALVLVAIGTTAFAHPGGANAPSSDLPPIIPEGYLSPNDVHARYAGPALEIVLSMVEHQPFAGLPPRYENCQPGSLVCDEHHQFESHLTAQVSVNNGPPMTFQAQGPVATVAEGRGPFNDTGTFDTEMLSMMLTGLGPGPMGPPVMIRESPTLASTGKTSITDIGPPGPGPTPADGYHIDSFFDVFTELSIDGGTTWLPSNVGRDGQSHPTRVHLGGIPEPSSFVLAGLALVGLVGSARRRK
jgi:hypothetical protein